MVVVSRAKLKQWQMADEEGKRVDSGQQAEALEVRGMMIRNAGRRYTAWTMDQE
jgi:hypothetical protein